MKTYVPSLNTQKFALHGNRPWLVFSPISLCKFSSFQLNQFLVAAYQFGDSTLIVTKEVEGRNNWELTLIEFPMRLVIICRNLPGSPISISGTPSDT
jgi:hypothetical protein